jgi:hypothetical protein
VKSLWQITAGEIMKLEGAEDEDSQRDLPEG